VPAEPARAATPGATIAGEAGSWRIDPSIDGAAKPAQPGKPEREAKAPKPGVAGTPGVPLRGLAARHKVDAFAVAEALGPEKLAAEREKARNTRMSRHRGAWTEGTSFGKYKAAIENYDPSVKLGNQTSLNAARVPFASFINKMHNRIHPIFADGFLGSLSSLDRSDKLSDPKLVSHAEIVLDGRDGRVLSVGIVRASGVTAFDVAALRSIQAAGPYGKPPDVIVSPDGKVYVHWEFYRDPYYACTSKFARPYVLKNKPSPRPDTPPQAPTEKRVGQLH
jgi:TonB family protein